MNDIKKNKRLISNNQKSIFRVFNVLFLFVFFSILSNVFISCTFNHDLDQLSYKINNYNNDLDGKEFVRPYVKVERKSNNNALYDDLYKRFYYSDDSGSIRQYMNNNCCYDFGNGEKIQLNLYSQSSFYILDTIAVDGGYRIDNGLFHAYFSSKELGSGGYLGKHFGCDSYIYISDIFADKLLETYGLEKSMDSYEKLINEERYAILDIVVDDKTTLKFSINNIIYSDKRSAPRCCEFNEFFGLINHYYVSEYFSPCIEIDLKAYSYYITSVLNSINNYGYTTDNCVFSFYLFDKNSKSYYKSKSIGEEYVDIVSLANNDTFFVSMYIMSIVIGSVVYSVAAYGISLKREILICVSLELLSLSAYSIAANYFYTFYLYSIMPLVLFLILLLLKGKRIVYAFKDRAYGETHLDFANYYEM